MEDIRYNPTTAAVYVATILYTLLNALLVYHGLTLLCGDLAKWLAGKRDGKERMTDLVRATVTVDPSKPWLAYHVMNYIHEKSEDFHLVRIKNKLGKLQHINANYVYKRKFLCEIQIRLGDPPPHYYANHFLYELQRAQTTFELLDTLNARAAWLVEHDALRW